MIERWFFLVSMVFWITEFQYVFKFSFVWCCDVMTLCYDVTKPDLPISACRCARKLILCLFPWFFKSLSSKILIIFICMISWRHDHDVMSWRHKNCLIYFRLWIRWKDDPVQDSMVFLVAYSRNVSVICEMISCHTSRHDVTSIHSITLQHSLTNLVVEPYWDYYTNSMLIVGIEQIIDTIFESCRQHVTTSRHDVTM